MARKWTRNEEILAFALYCKTSFGKIHSGNHSIAELAAVLGRTPGSVSMKMCNFARFDPTLRSRGISGLSNGSRLDEEIWTEFSKNLEMLENVSNSIFTEYGAQNIIPADDVDFPMGLDVDRTVSTRANQTFFRRTVLLSYENACCITGLAVPALLNASHIKPWRDSDPKVERTNPCNGLCLNALHDKAFDNGLITIDLDYRVVLSHQLKEVYTSAVVSEYFMQYEGKQIQLPCRFWPLKEFLAYHNEHVFIG